MAARPAAATRRWHPPPLAGRSFRLRGFPRAQRARLSAAIAAAGGAIGELTAAPSSAKDQRVFVVTDYWAHAAPDDARAARPPAPELVAVTEFWLSEMLRLHEWLEPGQHVFFTPPSMAPGTADLLSFPEDYDEPPRDRLERSGGRLEMLMPFSPANVFKHQVPLWPYYVAYLSSPMRDFQGLAAVIRSITGTDPRRQLSSLEIAVGSLSTKERDLFFTTVLPEMARLVLNLPTMFSTHPEVLGPLLDSTRASSSQARASICEQSVSFSKREALALVSACFFCVFPSQSRLVARTRALESSEEEQYTEREGNDSEEVDFPYFSMRTLFLSHPKSGDVHVKAEKLRCVLHYFLRVVPLVAGDDADRERLDAEVITFTRVAVDLPSGAKKPLQMSPQDVLDALAPASQDAALTMREARCESDRLIEDLDSHLQIDFANKFAGGGVFNSGCVQEEIRFLLSPELFIACLVFAKLEPNEAFVIHGTERYSLYGGYGSSFVYKGDFVDSTAFEVISSDGDVTEKRRRKCAIVGIDAVDYGGAHVSRQYSQAHIWRDLVKAYVGFAYADTACARWPIASGNWGCGVFRGDAELKFVIQWLAASLAGRDLVYVLFERDHELHDSILSLLQVLESVKEEHELQRVPLLLAQFLFSLDAALTRQVNVLRYAGKRAPRPSVLAQARDFLDTQLQGLKRLKLSSPPSSDPQASPRAGITVEASESPSRPQGQSKEPKAAAKAPALKSPSGGGKGMQQKSITAFFGKQQ